MSEIYKYKCPHCSSIKEENECIAEYHGKDAIFKECKCKSCGSIIMLTDCMLKESISCSNCGELNSMELWDKKCPSCGVQMEKLYHIPSYPQIKIVSLNNEYYYIDLITGKQCKIKEFISVNKYLSKFRVIKNDMDYWGLVDLNNNLVLPCIYLSVQINEFGNINVIYPRASYNPKSDFLRTNFLCFDIDLMGIPIHRYYDEDKEWVKVVKFPEYEAISKWWGDVAICVKGGKEGLVYKDGTTILAPIFEEIDAHGGNDYTGQLKDHNYIEILAGTYGEGLVCVEERICDENKCLQFFVDRHFNKVIVFDNDWADKNEISRDSFHINRYTQCHFSNGYLIIDSPVDDYYGHKYKIDRKGHAEYLGEIHYKEFRTIDLAEDLDYTGYEEQGYWDISDEFDRDAFDDNPDARWNVD